MLLKRVRPPYSQIMIRDPTAKVDVPLWPRENRPFVATDTCILCACQVDSDGPTDVGFGKGDEVCLAGVPIFTGTLKTPGRRVALKTVEGDAILELPTANTETLVRIWTNRRLCPDRVRIGLD
jgi:hypothetical protein